MPSVCLIVEVDNSCSEWGVLAPTFPPPLSEADGVQLAGYVIGSWLLAWCFRYLLSRFWR